METGGSIYIIKQQGKRPSEEFSPDKLHASILGACLSVRTPEGTAEQTARQTCLDVMHWCESRPEITSDDIRRVATRTLKKYNPEAAYLYQQQRLVI